MNCQRLIGISIVKIKIHSYSHAVCADRNYEEEEEEVAAVVGSRACAHHDCRLSKSLTSQRKQWICAELEHVCIQRRKLDQQRITVTVFQLIYSLQKRYVEYVFLIQILSFNCTSYVLHFSQLAKKLTSQPRTKIHQGFSLQFQYSGVRDVLCDNLFSNTNI